MKSIFCLLCAVAIFQIQTAAAQGVCQKNYVAAIRNCATEITGVDGPKTHSQSQRDCIKNAQAARKFCIASAAPLIGTPPLSADNAVKVPSPSPDGRWTGFYVGVSGGYGLGSGLGGVQAGYDRQLPSNNWVGGFEVEHSGR